ncbi:MAG: CCA tRNA nucleotidyltransferase [Clostridia bacterium]|nr:CCA tRNA nucleotidyltransferase [Clostridia bacterium]
MVKLSKACEKIIDTLTRAGFSAYAVGGAVRDCLLGLDAHDFDVTTSATPEKVKSLFKKTIDTGIAHGTVTVIIDKEAIEVTTFRSDGEYLDNRKPESITLVKDVREDLSRRDFAINALCYNQQEGLIDLFGGLNDLKSKIIRAIGNPEERFREDALRILRAVRFSAQLGFEIEENTKNAIVKCAHLVKNLSVERISSEFDKILMSDSPEHIKLLYDLGILEQIMPEMCACFKQEQNTRWHIYDVGTHSVEVIKNCPKVLYLRYAAFMHDWGKPHTKGINDLGEDMFRNHAKISAVLAENFCRKYKFSNERRDKIVRLVKYHDIEILPEKKYVKRAINKVGEEIFYDLICLKRADCLSQNLELTASRLPYIEKLFELYREIKENSEPFGLKSLKINGNDLKELGYEGKQIGEILNILLEKVIENPELNEKEKLIEIVKDLA